MVLGGAAALLQTAANAVQALLKGDAVLDANVTVLQNETEKELVERVKFLGI